MDKSALFKLSYGLFVVTANEGAKDNGCITNTVIQVTNDPLRISVTINKDNYTCGMIHRTGLFNVSILSEEASFEIFKHWGFQSGRDVDKALGIEFYRLENGVIYVTEGVNAVLCAKVAQEIDLGSHIMFIADLTDAFPIGNAPSATYTYYHKNIKPEGESDDLVGLALLAFRQSQHDPFRQLCESDLRTVIEAHCAEQSASAERNKDRL